MNFGGFRRLHHEVDQPSRGRSNDSIVVVNPLIWLLRVGVLGPRNHRVAAVVPDAHLFISALQFRDELLFGELGKKRTNAIRELVEELTTPRSSTPRHGSGLRGIRPLITQQLFELFLSLRSIDVHGHQTVACISGDDTQAGLPMPTAIDFAESLLCI